MVAVQPNVRLASTNQWSLVPIQRRRESPAWSAEKKNTLFPTKQQGCEEALGPGPSPARSALRYAALSW